LSEDDFVEKCTRCGDCIRACPQKIIIKGSGGYPEIDFSLNGCELCEECLDVCRDGALIKVTQAEHGDVPWSHKAQIQENCLSLKGTICRSCGEACDEKVIHFTLQTGGVAVPTVDESRCTGCGFCYAVCPVRAVALNTIA